MPKVKHGACGRWCQRSRCIIAVLWQPVRLKVLLINYQLLWLTLKDNGNIWWSPCNSGGTIHNWHLNNSEYIRKRERKISKLKRSVKVLSQCSHSSPSLSLFIYPLPPDTHTISLVAISNEWNASHELFHSHLQFIHFFIHSFMQPIHTAILPITISTPQLLLLLLSWQHTHK